MLEIVGPALDEGRAVDAARSDPHAGPHRRRSDRREDRAHARADIRCQPGRVTRQFTGSAGQSFGAFASHGMRLILEGEANDYVGKGMIGGEIAIRRDADAQFTTPQVIAGNTILYGATGGEVYLAGKAGERFARPQQRRDCGC